LRERIAFGVRRVGEQALWDSRTSGEING